VTAETAVAGAPHTGAGEGGPTSAGDGGSGLVLELTAVTKTYPGQPPVVALADVDLAVRAGELLAVVGPSG
jgi:ABC-type glutathione transport system ATPase component